MDLKKGFFSLYICWSFCDRLQYLRGLSDAMTDEALRGLSSCVIFHGHSTSGRGKYFKGTCSLNFLDLFRCLHSEYFSPSSSPDWVKNCWCVSHLTRFFVRNILIIADFLQTLGRSLFIAQGSRVTSSSDDESNEPKFSEVHFGIDFRSGKSICVSYEPFFLLLWCFLFCFGSMSAFFLSLFFSFLFVCWYICLLRSHRIVAFLRVSAFHELMNRFVFVVLVWRPMERMSKISQLQQKIFHPHRPCP